MRYSPAAGGSRWRPAAPHCVPQPAAADCASRSLPAPPAPAQGNCVVLPTRFEGAEAGANIIAAGPEPLSSQFSTSYGMVLNLLSVYSLDQARDFLSKSFGRYLSGAGNARRLKEVRGAARGGGAGGRGGDWADTIERGCGRSSSPHSPRNTHTPFQN